MHALLVLREQFKFARFENHADCKYYKNEIKIIV